MIWNIEIIFHKWWARVDVFIRINHGSEIVAHFLSYNGTHLCSVVYYYFLVTGQPSLSVHLCCKPLMGSSSTDTFSFMSNLLVRLWVQDLQVTCVTFQLKKKKKKIFAAFLTITFSVVVFVCFLKIIWFCPYIFTDFNAKKKKIALYC